MKEIIYNITQQTEGRVVTFGVEEVFSKDNVLGIINKTQSKVLYTPVQAANIVDVTCNEGTLTISLADNVPVILAGDELFVKLYDTTELAKQGSDPEATNTAIFNAVNTFLSRSVKYDKTTGNLTIENVELIIE
jgi:predicted secreted protein